MSFFYTLLGKLPLNFFILLGCIVFLSSCSKRHSSPGRDNGLDAPPPKYLTPKFSHANYKPYNIRGRLYLPKHHLEPTVRKEQVGVASWYGPGFHGKKTSNGDTYNMYSLTAAHPTLPIPCVILVTNRTNGKQVKLLVNDRGPFSKNRILDVSKKAAQVLEFIKQGVTQVSIKYLHNETMAILKGAKFTNEWPQKEIKMPLIEEIVHPAPARQTPQVIGPEVIAAGDEAQNKPLFIQVASFQNRANAENIAIKMQNLGAVQIIANDTNTEAHKTEKETEKTPLSPSAKVLHKVIVGPFNNYQKAESALKKIADQGFHDAKIRPV